MNPPPVPCVTWKMICCPFTGLAGFPRVRFPLMVSRKSFPADASTLIVAASVSATTVGAIAPVVAGPPLYAADRTTSGDHGSPHRQSGDALMTQRRLRPVAARCSGDRAFAQVRRSARNGDRQSMCPLISASRNHFRARSGWRHLDVDPRVLP